MTSLGWKRDSHPFSTRFLQRPSPSHPSPLASFAFMLFIAATLAACGGQQPAEASAGRGDTTNGAALFESLNCSVCHRPDGSGQGPSLSGLYGQTVPLQNGETVTVGDQYIRTSILNPDSDIHAGYHPIMPSYEGQISEAELAALVEYIRSLPGGK
jgi:mono/diheme cytochrome c family protein